MYISSLHCCYKKITSVFEKKFRRFAGIFQTIKPTGIESVIGDYIRMTSGGFKHGPKIERAPERWTDRENSIFAVTLVWPELFCSVFLETSRNLTCVFIGSSGRVCPVTDSVVVSSCPADRRLVNDRTTVIGARTHRGPQSICRGPSPAPGVPTCPQHNPVIYYIIPMKHFRGGSQKRIRSIPTTRHGIHARVYRVAVFVVSSTVQ